jgi:predicted dehydrogenase/threonine dehydrogenase-like Zn-dependent dehydrogenase
MKQVLLDLQSGSISVEEVPAPALTRGILVRNCCSVISAGTESSLINLAGKTLIGKAQERPDLFQKVINVAKKDGILSAYEQAMSRLSKPEPLGYSSAGVVTGTNVPEFSPGDRVACAGAGFANHAEYISVPKNLAIKIPDNVTMEDAAFTTIGSIAMQGIRNAEITVGERIVVIGLGLLGLITIQIAKAAGCRVYGIDVDPKKIALSLELGADNASNYENIVEKVHAFSSFGADKVIITAATSSNGPIETAGDLVRNKGRVVAVGAVGLAIPRDKYYEKEAEFVVSKSYGPGRYDRNYEEKGIDYPINVRWTEKRNMESFLELLSQGKINLAKIVTHTFPIEKAVQAYELIESRKEPYLGVLLTYADNKQETDPSVVYLKPAKQLRFSGHDKKTPTKTIGCIGAGIHATSTLYPNLAKLPVKLQGIATSTGLSGNASAKKFGFSYCTTDYKKILEDKAIDGVIIATRNDLHAKMTIEALEAGKDVFVEKPLATTIADLQLVKEAWEKSGRKIMVGFNRRHSPYITAIKRFYRHRTSPLIINYRINAGKIPDEHWVHDEEQGGGMLISEVCHFVDTMQYLCGAEPVSVYARSPDYPDPRTSLDNLQVLLSFKNGSTGTITYTTTGDSAYSKELVEVFGDQSVAMLRDYRELSIVKNGKTLSKKSYFSVNKGIMEELQAFVSGNVPDFKEAVLTTLTIFKIEESLKKQIPVSISAVNTSDQDSRSLHESG